MKLIVKLVVLLTLAFTINVEAQEIQWTSKEVLEVTNEIQLIEAELSITDAQKEYLKNILLNKNRSLKEGRRKNHKRKIILNDLEDVIRYGQPVNRHPGEENIDEQTEIISQKIFEEKFLNNSALLQELDLVITEE